MEPNFPVVRNWLSWSYEQKGMRDEAIAADLKQKTTGGKFSPEFVTAMKETYAASGWTGYWRKALENSEQESGTAHAGAYSLAQIYARLGDKDQAFVWLQRAYNEHSIWMIWLKVDPTVDSLRLDPRFHDLLQRLHLA